MDRQVGRPGYVDRIRGVPYFVWFLINRIRIPNSTMPKLRTHKATAKRIKKRGGKSLKRRSAYATHLLGKRSTKRKRKMRRNSAVSSANTQNVHRSLGLK